MYNYALKPRKINNFNNRKRSFFKGSKRQCVKHAVNEYFSSSISWQKRVIQLFLIFIALYGIYFLFFSSYLQIKSVVVEGNNEIPAQEIEFLVKDYLNKNHLLIFSNDNYFFFSSKKLESLISSKYFLDYLKIKRQKISTILIVIKEKPASTLYKIGGKEFLIDRDGIVLSVADGKEIASNIMRLVEIPEKVIKNQQEIDEQNKIIVNDPQYKNSSSTVYIIEEEDGNKIVKEIPRIVEIFEDAYPQTPEISKEYFNKDFMGKLMYLSDTYDKKFSQLKIDHFEYKKSKPYIITAITKSNFQIYFKLDFDIDSQLSNLYKYVVEEKNYDVKNIEYIDLRYENQVIIK